ncbi:uncharacterized protein FIBRA_05908 [Fibroporia radiculosa]|uniref:Uncharacterized protein n=1 Tax=Fibroporia radiculosa TaxID=599839 RepID=J4HYA6_9APHY|nr:uncharacterized protein FIBRA_05908 [Fibroporia radiculosa]CCM03762.1 predicted protein [Fibroporia radiculosa]
MHRRGRSRDVSPIALAGKPNDHPFRAHISVSLVPQSNLLKHPSMCGPAPSSHTHLPHTRRSLNSTPTAESPVASTSRLPSLPMSASPPLLSSSSVDAAFLHPPFSSSVASLSPEPSPLEPLTPPEHGDSYFHPYSVLAPVDYYDRPPSPPRTLKDQMQVAYALDNIHLAKILYLKMHGIEVTGDDDPRIAAVKDEDFTSSFVPPGGLSLEEADEQRCRDGQKRERERLQRRRREEKLRACQRLWEASAKWLQEEKAKVARRKEEEARQRRRLEKEAKDRETREREQEQLRHTRQVRINPQTQRPLLDYSTLSCERRAQHQPSPPMVEDDTLEYFVIPFSPARSPSSSYSISPPTTPDTNELTLPRLRHELAVQHFQSLSRAVPFADVIVSMSGPLFPQNDGPSSRSRAKLSTSQRELFDSMFETAEWGESELSRPNSIVREDPRTNQRCVTVSACVAHSHSSTSTSVSAIASTSVSTITRSHSWFSFGSRDSRSSMSTAITSPSSSLLSVKSPCLSPSPVFLPSPLRAETTVIRHACRHPALVRVSSSEHPLCSPTPVNPEKPAPVTASRGRARTRRISVLSSCDLRIDGENGLVQRVSRSVSSLMDMAAQFQRAYVKATMFSVGIDPIPRSRSDSRDSSPSRSPSRSPKAASSNGYSGRSSRLRPEGCRALALDVHVFLSSPGEEQSDSLQPTRTLIPLTPRLPAAHTVPPHSRVFPLPAPTPRSPFRVAQPLPGSPSLPRLRPVANPLLLRLQALQNVCTGRALTWEGRARDGRMSAGKEKLVGVAWEGIGRSSLGWEVSAAVF